MNLILIRHGQAKHNNRGEQTFAGIIFDNELTHEGKKNAKKIGKYLINEDIGLIVYSPLKRSKQTAEIIAEFFEKNGKDMPVKLIEELREIDIGDFAGHTKEEVGKLFPESARAFYNGEIEDWSFPNGENFQAVSKRIDILIKRLKLLNIDKKIVLSGHGMLNRVIFYKFLSERKDLWQPRFSPHKRIEFLTIGEKNDSQTTKTKRRFR